MSVVTPERSTQQRMDALIKANTIRSQRSQFKRDLKAMRVVAHDYILNPPDWLHSMKILDLLMALPKYGHIKANGVLRACRMSASKTVGGLSDRQRAELISHLLRR